MADHAAPSPLGPSIPCLMQVNPFTPKIDGSLTYPQTKLRGGLFYVGEANAGAGGGARYVFISDGSFYKFDPKTGAGIIGGPDTAPAFPQEAILVFDGAKVTAQPGFDWFALTGGNPPAFDYSVTRSDQVAGAV
jgi:hypothetical protein